jgi:Xaa-Pro aminopeptidase
MSQAFILYASTAAADMHHLIAHEVHDPFMYIHTPQGKNYVACSTLESARMRDVPSVNVIPLESLGFDDFKASEPDETTAELDCYVRALSQLGIDKAAIPPTFPTQAADFLRSQGVDLTVDEPFFERARRRKTESELASIMRAQGAAEVATASVSDAMYRSEVGEDGGLMIDGEPLTCEYLQYLVRLAYLRHGCEDAGTIVAHGPQTCIGHCSGFGQVFEGEPVTVDIDPRDLERGCTTDMTRTFVKGEINDELKFYYRLVKESYDRTLAAIRPGISTAELHCISCEPMIEAGQPTQLTKKPGESLVEGYFHSLGHGVGLDVHEPPSLNQTSGELVEGDVIAIEPGCYRQGFGGVRLESLVLVTKDGGKLLADYPYGMTPVPLSGD